MSRKSNLDSHIIFNPKSSRVEDREERILRYYIQQIEKQTASLAASSPLVEPAPAPAAPAVASPAKRKPGRPPKIKREEDSVKKEPRKRRSEDLDIQWGTDESDDERALRLKARKLRAAAIEVEEDAECAVVVPEPVLKSEKIKEPTPEKVKRPPGRPPKKHRSILIAMQPKPVRVPKKTKESPRRIVQLEPVKTEGPTVPNFRFVDDKSSHWWKKKVALQRVEMLEIETPSISTLPPFSPPLFVDLAKLCDEPMSWVRTQLIERFAFLQST